MAAILTLADLWRDFEGKVIPKEASPAQRSEMKRSFFAGAATAMDIVHTSAAVSDEHGMDQLSAMHRELEEFAKPFRAELEAKPPPAPLELAEIGIRKIGDRIAPQVPQGWGFVLIFASHGQAGHLTWLSTLERPGTIELLREIARRMEAREPSL